MFSLLAYLFVKNFVHALNCGISLKRRRSLSNREIHSTAVCSTFAWVQKAMQLVKFIQLIQYIRSFLPLTNMHKETVQLNNKRYWCVDWDTDLLLQSRLHLFLLPLWKGVLGIWNWVAAIEAVALSLKLFEVVFMFHPCYEVFWQNILHRDQ